MVSGSHLILFRQYKIGVLFLYIPFFLVQVLYSGNCLQTQDTSNCHTSYKHAQKQVLSLHHEHNSGGRQENIKLNKRFQPENSPACISPAIELPGRIKGGRLFCDYAKPFVPLFHFFTTPLRGPPVVV